MSNQVEYGRSELLHSEECDVIINTSLENPQMMHDLLPTVRHGIPHTWQPYSRLTHDIDPLKHTHLFVDNATQPRYIAKKRAHLHYFKDGVYWQPVQERQKYARSMVSVLNEINLSPLVREVLNSEEARTLALRYNLISFQLVEPLIALINKTNREKVVFYPFVEGATIDGPDAKIVEDFYNETSNKLTYDLIALFKENGIQPGDLGSHNVILSRPDVPNQGALYLVDIEGFYLT